MGRINYNCRNDHYATIKGVRYFRRVCTPPDLRQIRYNVLTSLSTFFFADKHFHIGTLDERGATSELLAAAALSKGEKERNSFLRPRKGAAPRSAENLVIIFIAERARGTYDFEKSF